MRIQKKHRQLKTLLVSPPFQRFTADILISAHHFPLGLGYVAGTLEQAGYPVEIYDADIFSKPIYNSVNSQLRIAAHRPDHVNAILDVEHEVWQEIENLFKEKMPDIIGVTTKSVTLPSAYITAEIAKRINKDVIVIFGGAGATSITEQVLQNPHVDFVVRGEGEQIMTELVDQLHSPNPDFYSIDGLSFKEDERIINNRIRKVVKDIDTLPYPARHRLLYADQLPDILYKTIQGDIMTSRGCPYACTFCAANVAWGGRSARMRSAEEVVKEVLYQKERYGVQRFMFWDDLFTVKRKRVIEICNLFIEKKANISWMCYIRVDTIDHELMTLMKQAGCIRVEVGVESGSNRVLKAMKKGITVEQTHKAAAILNDVGIDWTMLLMIGVPGETKEDMAATMELLNLSPNKVVFSVFSPYAGTALHDKLKKEGRLSDDPLDVNHYYADTMPEDEFRELFFRYNKLVDEHNNKMKYGHPDPPIKQLITISPPLTSIVDIKPQQFEMAHWGIEHHNNQILLWLGEGQAQGITGVLEAYETYQINLVFTVAPGPGRKYGSRRVELRFENGSKVTTKRWQIRKKANLSFKATLLSGSNKFNFFCSDQATVLEHPNNDVRPLLVLLQRITVLPSDQPSPRLENRNRFSQVLHWFKQRDSVVQRMIGNRY